MENYTENVKITNIYKHRFKSPWLYVLTRRGEINTMDCQPFNLSPKRCDTISS